MCFCILLLIFSTGNSENKNKKVDAIKEDHIEIPISLFVSQFHNELRANPKIIIVLIANNT